MRIAYFEPLSRAWDRTRVILWQPFDLANWLLLAFAAWVAGLTTDTGTVAATRGDSNDYGRHAWSGFENAWEEVAASAIWLPLIVLGIMFGIAFAVLLLWVTSRFKFIYLEGVVRGRAEIVSHGVLGRVCPGRLEGLARGSSGGQGTVAELPERVHDLPVRVGSQRGAELDVAAADPPVGATAVH